MSRIVVSDANGEKSGAASDVLADGGAGSNDTLLNCRSEFFALPSDST
jgi:hypothetical protein